MRFEPFYHIMGVFFELGSAKKKGSDIKEDEPPPHPQSLYHYYLNSDCSSLLSDSD